MRAKSRSPSSPPAEPHRENDGLTVMSAEEAFVEAKTVDWGPNFPARDENIDLSDIPEQDFTGPDIVRGKYRDLALAARGFVQLDADVRQAFPDANNVNRVLRGLIEIATNARQPKSVGRAKSNATSRSHGTESGRRS